MWNFIANHIGDYESDASTIITFVIIAISIIDWLLPIGAILSLFRKKLDDDTAADISYNEALLDFETVRLFGITIVNH